MSVEKEHPNPGEQGRADHSTGSTTQGGSNFGQGSSHLGGGSYQQGNVSNKGSNYENETDKLGDSTTGTNAEGSSAPGAGGGMTERPAADIDKNTGGTEATSADHVAGMHGNKDEKGDTKKLFEGDRRNTSLEQSSSMGEGKSTDLDADDNTQSRGWSNSTLNDSDDSGNKQ